MENDVANDADALLHLCEKMLEGDLLAGYPNSEELLRIRTARLKTSLRLRELVNAPSVAEAK